MRPLTTSRATPPSKFTPLTRPRMLVMAATLSPAVVVPAAVRPYSPAGSRLPCSSRPSQVAWKVPASCAPSWSVRTTRPLASVITTLV
ncbi:MAG: hypothetical protein QM767_14925 [Anaeromyxobacter sp.]